MATGMILTTESEFELVECIDVDHSMMEYDSFF